MTVAGAFVGGEAHDRAVRRLERALASSLCGDERMAGHHADCAQAMVELGVLEESEARDWTERIKRAAQPLPEVPGERRARARELLERQLERGAASAAEEASDRREWFSWSLQALLETGVIARDEQSSWMERLEQAVPNPASPRPPAPYLARELTAVAVGPDSWKGGLRITSAELYDDCVTVRWRLELDADQDWQEHVFPADHARDLAEAHGPHRLQDDLGTKYTLTPVNTMEFDWLHLKQAETLPGASIFLPATPPEATTLTVTCPAGEFHINLRDAG